MKARIVSARASLFILATVMPLCAEPRETLDGFDAVTLEVPSGFARHDARNMNDNGEIVGQIFTDGSHDFDKSFIGQGAYWTPDGAIEILPGHFFNTDSNGYADFINNDGLISGRAESLNSIWFNTTPRTLLRNTKTAAIVLSKEGTSAVAGFKLFQTASTPEAVIANINRGINAFKVVSENISRPIVRSQARAINGSQNIVGTFSTSENVVVPGDDFLTNGKHVSHALLIEDGGKSFQLLGALEPSVNGATPLNINQDNQIVGLSGSKAVLWQDGLIADLGGFGGSSKAVSINNRGQIVGSSNDLNGVSHAFIWDNGVIYDLSPALCETFTRCITAGISINNSNEILANVASTNGHETVKLTFTQGILSVLPYINAPLNFVVPKFFPEDTVTSGSLDGTTTPEPTPEPILIIDNDYNNDGIQDRIVKNRYITIELLNADGSVKKSKQLSLRSKYLLKIADFDGDSRDDLLIKKSRSLAYFFINDDLSLEKRSGKLSYKSKVSSAFIDRTDDGIVDTLIISRKGKKIVVSFNQDRKVSINK